MPEIFKSKGIVIKKTDFSNTSVIFHFITGDKGVAHILAKGAKSTKSPFAGKIELFHELECDYIKNFNSDLFILKECSFLRRFGKLPTDIRLFYIACYLAEAVSSFAYHNDDTSAIFNLLNGLLFYLDANPLYNDCFSALLFFDAKMIQLLGYQPILGKCMRCKCQINGEALPVYYPFIGLSCLSCLKNYEDKYIENTLNVSDINTLNDFFSARDFNPSFFSDINSEKLNKLEKALYFFIKSLYGKELKSRKFIIGVD